MLVTTDGERVEILHCGSRNEHSGPDFTDCKLKIGDTVWVGNVEIDLCTSDWNKHKHDKNKVYNSIIAHVVYENNLKINHEIPTIELCQFIDKSKLDLYEKLMKSSSKIPCEHAIREVDSFIKITALERKALERLNRKSNEIFSLLNECNNNWENVFYITLFRSFGTNVNALPMELLARNIPLQVLAKHKNNSTQIHALLFGVAGFLEQSLEDDYFINLKKEFEFLRIKYGLIPLNNSIWKTGKVRVGNMPQQRLAELSSLILNASHLFSKIIESKNYKEIAQHFKVSIDDYWTYRYNFSQTTNKRTYISQSFIHTIIANTVVPCMFAFAQFKNDAELEEKCLKIFSETAPEQNSITEIFADFGFEHKNVLQSQGIIELYKNYCNKKKCLQCEIGLQILRKK